MLAAICCQQENLALTSAAFKLMQGVGKRGGKGGHAIKLDASHNRCWACTASCDSLCHIALCYDHVADLYFIQDQVR